MTALLDGYDPQTATDTEKVNAVMTILNVAVEARNDFKFTESPVADMYLMLALTTETLDTIQWALAQESKPLPDDFGKRRPTGFTPLS